jgi:hypothetical protein
MTACVAQLNDGAVNPMDSSPRLSFSGVPVWRPVLIPENFRFTKMWAVNFHRRPTVPFPPMVPPRYGARFP